jgi:hypothetical protein
MPPIPNYILLIFIHNYTILPSSITEEWHQICMKFLSIVSTPELAEAGKHNTWSPCWVRSNKPQKDILSGFRSWTPKLRRGKKLECTGNKKRCEEGKR